MYESYKDLLNLIAIDEDILSNCKDDLKKIDKFLLNQGRPAGYPEGTSYIDADMIHGSRKELSVEKLQKIINERGQLESMIFLQEERLKVRYEKKKEIYEKLKKLEGLDYKVVYRRDIEGKTLDEIAIELDYSVDRIKQVSAKNKR